jgi:uncharacterized phage protein gp47/JayE
LQCTPYTSTAEFMEAWANLKNVTRIPATSATGTATFTGGIGTDIPAGTLIARTDNTQYTTNADYTIGSAAVAFTAVIPAAAGNAATGIALNLVTPLAGVAAGIAATPIVGGSDQELDDSLRTRMLDVYASPPAGGNSNDFANWALAVPGVTRAWVVGQGVGAGSVLIYIMLDVTEAAFDGFAQGTSGGASAENRITAASGDQLIVANAIYPLRPVTSLVEIATPTASPINFVIQSLSSSDAVTEGNIVTALTDCFVRLGSPLAGAAIYPSDTNQAIESAAGVARYTLISPITPIAVALGSLPTLGTVTFE